jgi:hypothetical protein
MRCALLAAVLMLFGATAGTTAAPPTADVAALRPDGYQAEVPLDEYLALLERIAPAARDGAVAYLDAFERRCRRQLSAPELRRLVADGNGDPLLMAMMRAAHLRDGRELARLGGSIVCGR